MEKMTLDEFVNWVAEDVSGDSDKERKSDFLNIITKNPVEAKRIVSNCMHGWIVSAQSDRGKIAIITDMSHVSEKILQRLQEVLTEQLGEVAA